MSSDAVFGVDRNDATLHWVREGRAICGAAHRELREGESTRDMLLCGVCLRLCEDSSDAVVRADALDVQLAEALRALDYRDYLRTRHWRRTREAAIAHYGARCVLCGSYEIEVHHRTYENLGRETVSDLVVLCVGCHSRWHSLRP